MGGVLSGVRAAGYNALLVAGNLGLGKGRRGCNLFRASARVEVQE